MKVERPNLKVVLLDQETGKKRLLFKHADDDLVRQKYEELCSIYGAEHIRIEKM